MRKFIVAILIATLLMVLIVTPVLAFLVNPASMGLADYGNNNIRVFRNLVETGDSLYIFHYKIAFTDDLYPVQTASDTMTFNLYNSSGNESFSFAPYVYPYFESNGYGDGIASIYFAAADSAPAWGSAARLTIGGWPAYFSGLTEFSYTLTTNDYITATSQEDNQAALKTLVLLWCDRLTSIYSTSGVVLKAASDSGQVLSDDGIAYFTGAIPGLIAMCPALFYIQVYVPTNMDTAYDMTMGELYGARAAGSEWMDGFEAMGHGLGVSGTVVATFLFAILSIIVCVMAVKRGWGIEAGAAISVFIGVTGALIMGNVLFAIMMIATLAAIIGLIWLLMLRRVG
jgi:hypothetical protein